MLSAAIIEEPCVKVLEIARWREGGALHQHCGPCWSRFEGRVGPDLHVMLRFEGHVGQ